MALAQLGIQVSQTDLARVLGARAGVGTPFSRVERLNKWNIQVQPVQYISVDDLINALTVDAAVIVALTTTPGLPGWGNIRTQHTVLVATIDAEHITYQDPALSRGPVATLHTEFLLAWSGMDECAAFLSNPAKTRR
jgi:hypothetical protein